MLVEMWPVLIHLERVYFETTQTVDSLSAAL
jgi:hypothetical protein